MSIEQQRYGWTMSSGGLAYHWRRQLLIVSTGEDLFMIQLLQNS